MSFDLLIDNDKVFDNFSKYISLVTKSLKYIKVLSRLNTYKRNKLIYRKDFL